MSRSARSVRLRPGLLELARPRVAPALPAVRRVEGALDVDHALNSAASRAPNLRETLPAEQNQHTRNERQRGCRFYR